METILPAYKPVGITSFDVIRNFKRSQFTGSLPVKYKIGHGGTLDPFADGVLLLLLGKATKKMNELSALPKTYRATAILGASSDTLDRTGIVSEQLTAYSLQLEKIKQAATKFVGDIEQEIPDYSATKINGVPRYKLARKGVAMESKSKMVHIFSIEDIRIIESKGLIHPTMVEMTVTCSAGTYIRQLSFDILKSLGIMSYLESLTRTKIGEYTLDKCCQIEDFSSLKWQDLPAQTGMAEHTVPPAPGA